MNNLKQVDFFLPKMLRNVFAIQINNLTFSRIIIDQNFKKKNYGKEAF